MRAAIRTIARLVLAPLAIGLFLSDGHALAAARVQQTGTVERIDIEDFGIYTAEKTEVMPAGRGARHFTVENVAIVAVTDTVQAVPGIKFGLRYRIIGEPVDAKVNVKIVVKYPPAGAMSPKNGLLHDFTYITAGRIGALNGAGYSADETWELVPGVWSLQLWVADKMYAEKSFTMVSKPAQEAVSQRREAN
jgi:hypothetical protein